MRHIDAGSIATRFMLYKQRWLRGFCLPNFTPPNWWECDIFELTKSGFFREYEIKTSRSDFLIDASKGGYKRWKRNYLNEVGELPKKHDLLANKSAQGPSQFYFITPPDLGVEEEVPSFAGHIHILERNKKFYFKEIKPAPRLHGTKCDKATEEKAREACYYRMHSLRDTICRHASDRQEVALMHEAALEAQRGEQIGATV